MSTDTTEKGLESLIMRHLTGTDGLTFGGAGVMSAEPPHPWRQLLVFRESGGL